MIQSVMWQNANELPRYEIQVQVLSKATILFLLDVAKEPRLFTIFNSFDILTGHGITEAYFIH